MLKDHLWQESVLYRPDFSCHFIVQTDALAVGQGTVLSQYIDDVLSQYIDGEEHLVLYISWKLFPRGQDYSVVEEEA